MATPTRQAALLRRVRQEKLPPLRLVDPKLAEPDLIGLLTEAVREYQRVRPRVTRATLTGDGTAFDFTLPDGVLYTAAPAWVQGFSALLRVEHPAGQRTPVYLDAEATMLYPEVNPTVLRFLEDVPATGTTALVGYTVPHVFGEVDEAVSVPSPDEEILVNMVARLACLALAGNAAENKDPGITADGIDYRDVTTRYLDLATKFGKLLPTEFQLAIDGKTDATVAAASGWVDWDARGPFEIPPIWHRNRDL